MSNEFVKNLPKRFVENVKSFPNFDGEKWLNSLPTMLKVLEKKWEIKAEKHFENLSYNYVAPCVFVNGTEAVLKIGLPVSKPGLVDEIDALKFYQGKGVVKLFLENTEIEAILIEKLKPGINLKKVFSSEKEKAIPVAINLLKQILNKKPKETEFPTLDFWFDDFNKKRNVRPEKEFDKASELLKEINSDPEQKYLLHGDFHHENILSSERNGFLAIDPEGFIGNIGFEIAVFLNQHAIWIKHEKNFLLKIENIVEQFSESFELTEEFLKKWAWTHCVLGAWWDFEDNIKGWKDYLELSKVWEKL